MANTENNFWQEIQREISENIPDAVPTVAQTQGLEQTPPSLPNNSYSNENYRLPFNNERQIMNNDDSMSGTFQNGQVPYDSDNILSILKNNLGYYVICDFLIGTGSLDSREGILYASGVNYLTLYHPQNETYTVCDIYSLKFITFYNSTTVPSSRSNNRTNSVRANAGASTRNNRKFY